MKKLMRVLPVVLCVILLAGCGSTFDTAENCIYVKNNGQVIEASVEAFDQDNYDEDELSDFMDEAIDAYNDSVGSKAVKLKKLTVEDGMATSFITYKTPEDYAAFSGTDFFYGTVEEAYDAGYSLSDVYYAVDGTATGDATEGSLMDQDLKIAITSQKIGVKVKGTIQYVSDNVKLLDENTVSPLDTATEEPIVVIYK